MEDIQTELVQLKIGDFNINVKKVKNIDSLYDDLISKGQEHEDVKDERIPYWAELWPSSIGLSSYLVRSGISLEKKKILEIGCGLGLVGITAGLLNGNIVLSDYSREALNLSMDNWNLNIKNDPKTALIDWRNPDLNYKSDIILASDVLYEKRSHKHLIDFFRSMLKDDGFALVADPQRSATKEFVKTFSPGIAIEKICTEIVDNNGMSNAIDIYKISAG